MAFPPQEPPDPSTSTEHLYALALGRLGPGQDMDLAALCAAHPEHAEDLRRTHELWQEISCELRGLQADASLAERLRSRYGPGTDPNVSLQGTPEVPSDFSSEVLSRLSGRQPTTSRYRLEGEIARGGMGAILRVWDEDLRRHLAMKVVLGQSGVDHKGGTPAVPTPTLARFLEEAQVTGQLDHPGIVPVHELGLDANGRVYFTMKLVKGKTLKAVFDELAQGEGGWTQTRVLGLILRVCEAMAYAHDKQVIHRDLKPANVMVGRFGEVYVMDWGLAKILGREDTKDLRVKPEEFVSSLQLYSDRQDRQGDSPDSPLYTMDGDVVGTPAYMSPEQAAGQVGDMGPASDVYALGAMLYHLMVGHMPYAPRGAKATNYAIWRWVQEGPPKAVHELAPLVPAELVAICEKAMARDPADRYRDTSALARDLSAYVEGRVVGAYETGAWAEARKWVKRNKALAVSAAAAALAVLIGGVGFAFKADQASRAAERARSEAQRADGKTHEAQLERKRAEAETAKVLRLSDVKVLQELEAEAEALWPAYPEEIDELESWLERAKALAANLPGHVATLTEMRARALPWSDSEQAADRATHPRALELAEKQAQLKQAVEARDQADVDADAASLAARVTQLELEADALHAQVEARRTWNFDTPQEEWQHDVLAELIGNLEELESGLLSEDAVTAKYGWSVPRRLTFARDLERDFAEGGAHARAWAAALPAISRVYPGLELQPQMGLLPLGPDPVTGLWEFGHLMTGEPAERAADGSLILTERTGLVLVLLPGGSFWMGAQKADPDEHNYDPEAQDDELPVHQVTLSPYFLSKFELTQGQWKRVAGRNPSLYGPDGRWDTAWLASHAASTLLHPVEQITWTDCDAWVARAGLRLPSEAQWECGARAGTQTPWWTGQEEESLIGAANLVDNFAKQNGGEQWVSFEPWLDDGATVHAPVHSYAGNAFGLHEMTGNVWEWCQDGYDPTFYANGPELDPLAPNASSASRVLRGGSCDYSAAVARSSDRNVYTKSAAGRNLGLRPASPVLP